MNFEDMTFADVREFLAGGGTFSAPGMSMDYTLRGVAGEEDVYVIVGRGPEQQAATGAAGLENLIQMMSVYAPLSQWTRVDAASAEAE